MRTVGAPTAALRDKITSVDALTVSTAILAAPYTVLQPNSLDDWGSLILVSEESQHGNQYGRQLPLAKRSAPIFLAWNGSLLDILACLVDSLLVSLAAENVSKSGVWWTTGNHMAGSRALKAILSP